jgi:UDP-N-acetylglucosamine 2-epimerase (non-hydrolysing)
MKLAPVIREINRSNNDSSSGRQPSMSVLDAHIDLCIVHTGQHYDRDMSDVFFEELGIPEPNHYLEVGSGSHAQQTGEVMVRFERVCMSERPDLVMVVGDVNSTMACAIAAKKLRIPVAHVEAGLRSGDMSMPEEINRVVTDSICDVFFATEQSAVDNLLREGKDGRQIHFVGHVMIDTLLYELRKLEVADTGNWTTTPIKARLRQYGVITLHRPSNVDDPQKLTAIMSALRTVSETVPLVFPVHPRTRVNLEKTQFVIPDSIILTRPLGYREFLNLWKDARIVITDSGGLQEETTALGVPCVTVRDNTERPITLSRGTNRLAGTTATGIVECARLALTERHARELRRPPLWDGNSAARIVDALRRWQASQIPRKQ